MTITNIISQFFQWWATVAGMTMGITVAIFALAGSVYQPTSSAWIAWAWSSALAAILIVAMQLRRQQSTKSRPTEQLSAQIPNR